MAEIQVEHLKYKYPLTNKPALYDISFRISAGEFIGIVGENGAGKSTLCQALTGIVPHFHKGAYGGKILIDDLEVKKSSIGVICQKVGLVFQNPFNQVTGAKLTVYEEVSFGLENMGIPREEMHKRIDSALKLLGIYEYRKRNPFDLSGGQMQRMAIASIIAMQPEVIILDEPTSQLDPQGSEEVFQAVQQLTKVGITIIMVEHKIEKIAQYCDRVILLKDGKLVDFAAPQVIFSRSDLAEQGIVAPVYTRLCQALERKNIETGYYPVTLQEAQAVLQPRREN